jgi:hypothetical protein
MVLMAVVVITSDRLTRGDDPLLRNMANPVPPALLGRCNLASIAAATGLNRENVRRIVDRVTKRGILVRSEDGLIQFAPGHIQEADAAILNMDQLSEFGRAANVLLKDGILRPSQTADARVHT